MSNGSPRYFFDTFLKPNYDNWCEDTDNVRLAMNAAVSANQMADWCFIYWSDHDPFQLSAIPPRKVTEYRDFLASNECADFAVVRDVADSHKHLEVTRTSSRVSSAIGVHTASLGWDQARWDEGKFGGVPQLVVHFDDGTKRAFSAPLKNVFQMWTRLLTHWGI